MYFYLLDIVSYHDNKNTRKIIHLPYRLRMGAFGSTKCLPATNFVLPATATATATVSSNEPH